MVPNLEPRHRGLAVRIVNRQLELDAVNIAEFLKHVEQLLFRETIRICLVVHLAFSFAHSCSL